MPQVRERAEVIISPGLLAIFAHPDDESFRCGGTLALAARHGVRVHLLTATRGEAGIPDDSPMYRPEELAQVRMQELRCACRALGIAQPRILDYRDGHLEQCDMEELTRTILDEIETVHPQVLMSFRADGLSGHPDHIAVGRCVAAAFERAEEVAALYTVVVPRSLAEQLELKSVQGVPDEWITLTVDVSAVWKTKMAAIRCYATQVSSSPMLRAPAERQRAFFGVEHFIRAACRHPEQDFLARMFV